MQITSPLPARISRKQPACNLVGITMWLCDATNSRYLLRCDILFWATNIHIWRGIQRYSWTQVHNTHARTKCSLHNATYYNWQPVVNTLRNYEQGKSATPSPPLLLSSLSTPPPVPMHLAMWLDHCTNSAAYLAAQETTINPPPLDNIPNYHLGKWLQEPLINPPEKQSILDAIEHLLAR